MLKRTSTVNTFNAFQSQHIPYRGPATAWDTALTPGSACDIVFYKIFNSKKIISSL